MKWIGFGRPKKKICCCLPLTKKWRVRCEGRDERRSSSSDITSPSDAMSLKPTGVEHAFMRLGGSEEKKRRKEREEIEEKKRKSEINKMLKEERKGIRVCQQKDKLPPGRDNEKEIKEGIKKKV